MIRIILFLLLTSGQMALFAQSEGGQNAPVFVAIPAISKQLQTSNNQDSLKKIYSTFQKDYPKEKFEQVGFLLDQIEILYSHKMLHYKDSTVVVSALRISQHLERRKVLHLIPETYWQSRLADSLNKAFHQPQELSLQNQAQTILVYSDFLYFREGGPAAWSYLQKMDPQGQLATTYPQLYAILYAENGQPDKGLKLMVSLVKGGNMDSYSKIILKSIWNQINPTLPNDYEAFYNALNDQQRLEKAKDLQKRKLNYTAPTFDLLDLDGKLIRLTDLKGKIVFLDFWATWCGPCISAFPAMQEIIKKHKSREDLVFLFINTLEKDENDLERTNNLKSFLSKKKVNFQVLLDKKTENNFETIQKYKVSAIPAQFLIDKAGNVRYRLNGFDGNTENLIQEIDLMLESLASN